MQTEIAVRILRATAPRVRAREPVERESLTTDSCDLRPKRPVCGSVQAFGAKFFSIGELRAIGLIVRRKTRAMRACGVCLHNKLFLRDTGKSRYSSAFLRGRNFLACVRVDAKFFPM